MLLGKQILDLWFHRFGPCPVAHLVGCSRSGMTDFDSRPRLFRKGGV